MNTKMNHLIVKSIGLGLLATVFAAFAIRGAAQSDNTQISGFVKDQAGGVITFRVEGFNWLNHPNWNGPNTDPTDVVLDSNGKVDLQRSTFGKISGKGGNRELQFALRYQF